MTHINENFGHRMKALRKKLKLTLANLEKLTKIKAQYLSSLENNKHPKVGYHTAKKIANALNTTPSYLVQGSEYKTYVNFDRVNKFAPILKWDEILQWINQGEKMSSERDISYLTIEEDKPESCFCLKIVNDSMKSTEVITFNIGEYIIIDPTIKAENGNFIVFKYLKSPESVFRQLIIEGNKKYLKPLNSHYPIEFIEDERNILFLGVVIERRIKL